MSDAIRLMDAPPMPGLMFRSFRGAADLAGMAAVRAACALRDRVDDSSSVESVSTLADLERRMVRSEGFDPARDVLVAEVEGRIVGYSAALWWTETDETWVYLTLGWVLSEWRGRGIGTAMLRWTEGRLHELAASHRSQERAVLAANASEREVDTAALLVNEGYRVVFSVIELGIDNLRGLRALPLPEGFVTRPVVSADLPALYRSIDEAYLGDPFSESEPYEAWATQQADLSTWHVAWDEATGWIAGQVQVVLFKGRGEVAEVSAGAPYRRRGLGRALLSRALLALREQGLTAARIHTLAENPHRSWHLYESVGFRVLKRFPRYRKAMNELRPPESH
jgi:ribosomal protein S18 acetylase RimI-like enzyme